MKWGRRISLWSQLKLHGFIALKYNLNWIFLIFCINIGNLKQNKTNPILLRPNLFILSIFRLYFHEFYSRFEHFKSIFFRSIHVKSASESNMKNVIKREILNCVPWRDLLSPLICSLWRVIGCEHKHLKIFNANKIVCFVVGFFSLVWSHLFIWLLFSAFVVCHYFPY